MVDCGGLFGNRGELCFFYQAFAYSKLWGFKQMVRAVDFGGAGWGIGGFRRLSAM